MKKWKLMVMALPMLVSAFACSNKAKLTEQPAQTLVLKIKGTGGTNGTAVVYNPEKKIYYTAIAGNVDYPLDVFDASGTPLHNDKIGFDVRGMWWNAKKKMLEANGYGDFGVAQIDFNASTGIPTKGLTTLAKESSQPNEQSVGAYDFKNDQVIYYNNGALYKVNRKDFTDGGSVKLELPVSADAINANTVIYTGYKGKEAGVLDFENKKVYLFNIKNGKHTYTITLSANARCGEMFRFSFANGYVWLYDTGTRSWTGYKITS